MNVIKAIKDLATGKTPKLKARSGQWPATRKAHLKVSPYCVACGGWEKLEVHHTVHFHVDPTKELDPANLLTLCESKKRGLNCHLFVGHGGNYLLANEHVEDDAKVIWLRFFGRKLAVKISSLASEL